MHPLLWPPYAYALFSDPSLFSVPSLFSDPSLFTHPLAIGNKILNLRSFLGISSELTAIRSYLGIRPSYDTSSLLHSDHMNFVCRDSVFSWDQYAKAILPDGAHLGNPCPAPPFTILEAPRARPEWAPASTETGLAEINLRNTVIAGVPHSTTSFQAHSRAGTGFYFWCTIGLQDDDVAAKYAELREKHGLALMEEPAPPLCSYGCGRKASSTLSVRRSQICNEPGEQRCRVRIQQLAETRHRRERPQAGRGASRTRNRQETQGAANAKDQPQQKKPKKQRQKQTHQPSASDTGFVVERIVGERQVGKATEFHVKWLGYDTAENTWEPESNIDAAESINAFRCVCGG